MEIERMQNGIPLNSAIVEDLQKIADKFSITFW
jgi:LDH2 family malate/lactate/ureidoglycolate dehydrogenase